MEKCYYCDTELEKDDVALCKKLLGKKIKQYFCREHLAEVLDTDVDTLTCLLYTSLCIMQIPIMTGVPALYCYILPIKHNHIKILLVYLR